MIGQIATAIPLVLACGLTAVVKAGGLTFSTYTTANGLGSNHVIGVYADGNRIYAATAGGLSISSDGGASWINYNQASNNGLVSSTFTRVYAAGSSIYVSGGGVAISKDAGASWKQYSSTNGFGIFAPGLGNLSTTGIYADSGKIYAATYGGGLSVSSDDGQSWTSYTQANGLGYDYTQGVFASGNVIYVATQSGLSISRDGGSSWTIYDTAIGVGGAGNPNQAVFDVFARGSSIYAATQKGVVVSNDDGSSWSTYTAANGLGDDVVNGVYADGNRIYAATNGGLSIAQLSQHTSSVPGPLPLLGTGAAYRCSRSLRRRLRQSPPGHGANRQV